MDWLRALSIAIALAASGVDHARADISIGKAGTTDPGAVAQALRQERFDTVPGTIGFDAKGDVAGFDPFVWYVWTGGKWVPKNLTE